MVSLLSRHNDTLDPLFLFFISSVNGLRAWYQCFFNPFIEDTWLYLCEENKRPPSIILEVDDISFIYCLRIIRNINHDFFYPRPVLAYGYFACVSPSVRQRDNSTPIQARINTFGPYVYSFGGRLTLTFKVKFNFKINIYQFWACPFYTRPVSSMYTEANEAPLEERRLKLSMHYYLKTLLAPTTRHIMPYTNLAQR